MACGKKIAGGDGVCVLEKGHGPVCARFTEDVIKQARAVLSDNETYTCPSCRLDIKKPPLINGCAQPIAHGRTHRIEFAYRTLLLEALDLRDQMDERQIDYEAALEETLELLAPLVLRAPQATRERLKVLWPAHATGRAIPRRRGDLS